LGAAFEKGLGWDNPDGLLDNLWKTPELRAIYNAIETYVQSLGDDVIIGPRKTFSGFSRKYQFVAARPVRGKVRLGVAVDPDEYNLEKAKASDSWSDRVTSIVIISSVDDINEALKSLIQAAWANS
jgi:predicted transport protein